MMSALKILVIPGSLRSGSLNARLAATLAAGLTQSMVFLSRAGIDELYSGVTISTP